ncbi:hypothetical protein [Pedobacter boryungensis]|uniref:Transposase n=1 Tax=Pedobacter boryungensis TaxID=869962 RepID=A0ABX2DFJ1_9SPHI|nr:hypothetical protein [Pedobacter boryungensis]NQX32863.1 hypothetical protein [Pedobacter boryungensis]
MKVKSASNKKKVDDEFSSLKTKKQKRDALIKLISNIIVRMTFEECYGKENELENLEN